MIFRGHLWRALALAGLVLGAAPAMAAPADVELLKSYIGDWRGRGLLHGAETETVVCRLALTQGNQDKVNYNGRCTLAGTNVSIGGTLAYVEEKKRYEAVMSTNITFSGVAVGKRQGGGLVFNLRERNRQEGKDYTISADITLKKSDIQVTFTVIEDATGDMLYAEVPFTNQ